VLQDGGLRPPVFVFHHPSGTVLAYEPLAHHLGDDQLVYGIQARGVDGGMKPFASIEAMAVDYADLIERTDPSGSYRLVGHSIGGLLAWETARVLHRRGYQVAFLALLDSLFPDRRWFRPGIIDGKPASAGMMMLREVRRAFGDVRWGLRWTLYAATRKPLPPADARLRLIRASSRAFDRYRPEPFDGRVVYVEASENLEKAIPTKSMEWAQLCDELEVVVVPGTHSGPDSILGPQHVENVGIELRKRLEALAAAEGRVA
jgi:thioesterase domain-containing protein